jgi:hypothetical protein
MSLESHRHVFIKPSKWFTEDIGMIFFCSGKDDIALNAVGDLGDACPEIGCILFPKRAHPI